MSTHIMLPRALRRSPLSTQRLAAPGLFADFDRFFDAFWRREDVPAAREEASFFAPPLDYTESDSEIRIAAELPGLEEQDIRVSLEDGVLSIEGERVDERNDEDEQGYRHVESLRGRFRRAVRLGAEIDEAAVVARYKNGILSVTLPKVAGPEVRSIPVTSS